MIGPSPLRSSRHTGHAPHETHPSHRRHLNGYNLGDNVYLIDTNKHYGSGSEGAQELVTTCLDGQVMIWSVTPVNPGDDAEIAGFTGAMVDQKVCSPRQATLPTGDTIWTGRVESQGATARYQYSCSLSFDGKAMAFDPFLDVTAT